jgi:hypothetical protein
MKMEKLQELKSAPLSAWSLIPQDTLNKFCKELQPMLQLCLVNHEE